MINALDPPSQARPFSPPVLSRCTLERNAIAQSDGGHQEGHDVIVETSGRAWLFEREIGPAVCEAVESAVEVQREGPDGPYVKLYDENNRTRRVTVVVMPKRAIDEKRGQFREDPMNGIAALDILSAPGHRHVLQKVAALEDDETVYLVMPATGMRKYQGWKPTSREEMETVRNFFRQLVEGLEDVHSKGICHARVCLNNVLFDESREHAYITNFGWSLLMPVDGANRRLKSVPDGRQSEASYCSPETFKGQAYDGVKVDVFAAGAMLFRMLAGRPPFKTASRIDKDFKRLVCDGEVAEAIGQDQLELIPNGEMVVTLLKGMMARRPEDRLSLDQVLQHPWMAPGV